MGIGFLSSALNLQILWGYVLLIFYDALDERSIDVYVMRLRKSLQKHGHDNLIKTVRGVGYRFNQ